MNNSDLIDLVVERHSVGKADAKAIMATVFEALLDAAQRNEEVAIYGFGKFKVKEYPARKGFNPATGDAIVIAASRKLCFSPGRVAKDRLR